jgi:CubicO group peptidase (beta-lactamase class C family)
MKVRILALGIIYLLSLSFIHAQNSNVQEMERFIAEGMEQWKIPGMQVLVVKDGKTQFKRSYGVQNVADKVAVNNETLFTMASTTKALIAFSMAMLVDRGQLDWNDKVRDHYPEFRLKDPYITESARVKELLTHNLGMGNADLLWVMDSTNTRELLNRFAKLDPSYPLRGGYTYQNIMYAIAGEVITKVDGRPWWVFVKEEIFEPLGMERSFVRSKDIMLAGNYTQPYYHDYDDGVVQVSHTWFDQVGAAGMGWSCIDDMEKYMSFILNGGVVAGDTLITPQNFEFVFQPHAIISADQFYPTVSLTKPNWTTYGLGWFQHDYKGNKVDFHTGSIAGLVAIAGLIRSENIAVYVFANLDHAELRHAIMYKAFDLFVYKDERDWNKEIFDLYEGFKLESYHSRQEELRSRNIETDPSVKLSSYSGVYAHPIWGSVQISFDNKLSMVLNTGIYELEHWEYNTFRTVNKDSRWRQHYKVSFALKGDKVQSLELFGHVFTKEQ